MTQNIATLTIDQDLPLFRIDGVSPEGMKVWAKALHDPNPIHLDAEVVKAKGWGDKVINQGPANLAYIINMLQRAFPGGSVLDLQARYLDNVFGGDVVEAGGKVLSVDAAAMTATCEVWLRAEGRGNVITGTAVVRTA